jgi:putative ABC transport system permease protein
VVLLMVMHRWRLRAGYALYANGRMLVQLLAIGYVLTFIFDTDQPLVVAAVLALMILIAAWIALRPLPSRTSRGYVVALAAIGAIGVVMLFIVTQLVLDLERWFDPRFVIPLAGMIFSNAMNTTSLAAERYHAERDVDRVHAEARRIALDAALIPQINSLLAVGLVALPGMMTGQILSGIDPLTAVRYQIMVMCMLFGSSGLAAAAYLALHRKGSEPFSRKGL